LVMILMEVFRSEIGLKFETFVGVFTFGIVICEPFRLWMQTVPK
jgi:hypothetical protein